MDIGIKIRDARIAKNLTQEELGRIVGLQKSAIAKYENGRVVNIKRSTLQKLAQALDLRGSDLIVDTQDTPTQVLSEGELQLVNLFRQIPADQQGLVLQMIRVVLNNMQ